MRRIRRDAHLAALGLAMDLLKAKPTSSTSKMHTTEKVDDMSAGEQRRVRDLVQVIASGHKGAVGEVFGYAIRLTDDNPNLFVTGLTYFKNFVFLAATEKPEWGPPLVIRPE